MTKQKYDVVVVGSGPNGFAAAIAMAQRGLSVVVIEGAETLGGGTRSAELTLPGFVHDVCSAIHPMGLISPFFKTLPLAEHGLKWITPPAALAHPFDDLPAAIVENTLVATAAGLGEDGPAYERLMAPLVRNADALFADLVGPFRIPRHPIAAVQFGWRAIQPSTWLCHRWFKTERAKALFAGSAGHSMLPLDKMATSAIGLMLLVAGHTVGWPFPEGGAQAIGDALASHFKSLGGEIVLGQRVEDLKQLPESKVVLLDLTTKQVLKLGEDRFPAGYRHSLESYRYGPGAFKIDWALDGPIPWNDPACGRAATVHLGGTLAEIKRAEQAAWLAESPPPPPYLIVTQPSLFDPTRAPAGKHTAWAYAHVPNGSTVDMLETIETQMERFATGFRDRILARHVMSPGDFETYNPNYVGGDINGGAQDLWQIFTRPTIRLRPYRTAAKGLYICSSATPPGGGVHGMCGYFAAQTAIGDFFR
ncbi:MAG: NAD(P)/FAD-dependent oxidoreductase [Pirellulaceae bacterium]